MEYPDLTDEIIQCTNSCVRWADEGIVHVKWNTGLEIEISDVDEMSEAFMKLTQGEKVKIISEFGQYVNITTDAREHAARVTPDCSHLAYVIKGLAQRIIIRFYIRMRQRQCPTKVFESYEEALYWIKAQ